MPVLDKSYFDYCLEQMKEYSTVFIFSDDIEWVENNLDYKRSIIVKNLEDYEEMWLMSLCKNNVMSNSSFSWWGSFLNKNKNKTVFVPSIWFGPKGPKSFYNIYEAEWNKINVKYSNGRLLHSKSKSFFKLFSK